MHGVVVIDQTGACRVRPLFSRASAREDGCRAAGAGAGAFLGAVGRARLRTEAFDEAGEGRGTGDEAGEGRGTHGVAGEGE